MVSRAQLLQLLQRVALCPFADRDHHDHRRHADDDAQRRQQTAQLMEPQVLEAQTEGFKQEIEHERRRTTDGEFTLRVYSTGKSPHYYARKQPNVCCDSMAWAFTDARAFTTSASRA